MSNTVTTEPSTPLVDMTSISISAFCENTSPIFLQTRAAQGIAGAFVWAALFLTCQQVLYDVFAIFLLIRRIERTVLM